MKKSLIYTRTGDKGSTSLIGGIRVSKTHERLEAYGTVDELNSFIGLLKAEIPEGEDSTFLLKIQHMLFSVGTYLATDTASTPMRQEGIMEKSAIEELEREIDKTDASVPPLKSFVIPGGNKSASLCHVCRTVCRRAERRILVLQQDNEIDENITSYVNRLSDYFFVLSRKLNNAEKCEEIFWNKSGK